MNLGVPAWAGNPVSIAMMFVLAVVVERSCFRPLVNQPDIILFMAAIGLNTFLIGFGETIFGGEPKTMITEEIGLPTGRRRLKCWAASSSSSISTSPLP